MEERNLSSNLTEESKSIDVVFHLAHDELLCLLDQEEKLAARITTVKQSLVALAKLFGDHLLEKDLIDRRVLRVIRARKKRSIGLTSAMRVILSESDGQLTTHEVYRLLLSRFPESVQHHKTPTSSIATVLKRLTISGELMEARDRHNVRVWEARNGEKSLGARSGS